LFIAFLTDLIIFENTRRFCNFKSASDRLFGGITEYFVAGTMALASVKNIEPSITMRSEKSISGTMLNLFDEKK
jgi:hypothetical protein